MKRTQSADTALIEVIGDELKNETDVVQM